MLLLDLDARRAARIRNGLTSGRHGVASSAGVGSGVELLDVVVAEALDERVLGVVLDPPGLAEQVAEPGRGWPRRAPAPAGSRRVGRSAWAAASAAVSASRCGASSPVSQPAKNAGMPDAGSPGSGRIALAVRAAVTSWRRRNDMPTRCSAARHVDGHETASRVTAGRVVVGTRTRSSLVARVRAMDRLSGLDASFLYLETPAQLMHVCGVIVLDPSTMPDGYSFAAIRDGIDARVRDVPEFTRKLRRVPLGLDHPVWVRDKHFDIERHVHRLALPTPGRVRRARRADRPPRRPAARPLAAAVGDVGDRGVRRRGRRERSWSSRRCTTPPSTASRAPT